MQRKPQHSPNSTQRRILSFWHKIEFFIPFDLQRQVLEAKDAEWSVRRFTLDQLAGLTAEALWSASASARVPKGRLICGFDVYLGVFDKADLADAVRRVIATAPDALEVYEQDERGGLEGLTCSASLMMSDTGVPLLDHLSVSTVPWALGKIDRQGLGGLDFDGFREDLEPLKVDVKAFRATKAEAPADGADLLSLLKILADWSGHDILSRDPSASAVVILTKSEQVKPKQERETAQKQPAAAAIAPEEDEDGAAPEGKDEIGILNSFFANDIEKAITALDNGSASAALQAYLTPVPPANREDLYEQQGQRLIAEQLRPKYLNSGRWPGNPAHAMSLMQQFAVNSIFEQLQGPGIFSVNGPPGTGKTTLLREIIAENIVRRARALSRRATSGAAFDGTRKVNFKEAECPNTISVLKEELSGFEMVVASSNNAAVENISRDLPKKKSLGKPASPGEDASGRVEGEATVSYLQPVARNLFEWNNKGWYDLPKSDDDAWGLISCALGKKRNRDAFIRGISFGPAKRGEDEPEGAEDIRHQSLWQWRDKYADMTFEQAKKKFEDADAAVRELVSKLDRLAVLSREFAGVTVEAYCEAAADAYQAAFREHALAEGLLTEGTEEGKPLKHSRKRAFGIRFWNEAEQGQKKTKRRVFLAKTVLSKAETALKTRQQEWADRVEQLQDLWRQFPQAVHPASVAELDDDQWQIEGLWQSDLVNEKRSALFVAALKLHEAWLAEVLKTGAGFGANVVALCNLLKGKRPQDPQHALEVWRSLFMIVPVVSSTFASFARQFQHLGPSSIGWLFIDEAGQAVPQAAVGALLRAKRAVVVGDPLQIEPVFTVPIKLLDTLAKSSALPEDMEVSPARTSVQVLADQANRLGAHVESGGKSLWIGSPLRVHRRCVDPMFSIANEIAYEGKMIFFAPTDPAARLPPPDSLDTGASAWVHASGATSDKQVVPNQIEIVHQALLALYRRTGTLPRVYIISPFKRVTTALIERLNQRENWASAVSHGPQAPKKTALRDWCKARIGTVHTFQGKEESMVWLVLGCDHDTAGAAYWASDKPNLLNVAVTRAQHRCFLIGDQELWGGLRHFTAAHAGRMPRITPKQFVRQMGGPDRDASAWATEFPQP